MNADYYNEPITDNIASLFEEMANLCNMQARVAEYQITEPNFTKEQKDFTARCEETAYNMKENTMNITAQQVAIKPSNAANDATSTSMANLKTSVFKQQATTMSKPNTIWAINSTLDELASKGIVRTLVQSRTGKMAISESLRGSNVQTVSFLN